MRNDPVVMLSFSRRHRHNRMAITLDPYDTSVENHYDINRYVADDPRCVGSSRSKRCKESDQENDHEYDDKKRRQEDKGKSRPRYGATTIEHEDREACADDQNRLPDRSWS